MIYFICVILCIVFWVLAYKTKDDWNHDYDVAFCVGGMITGLAVFIMTIFILINVIGSPALIARSQQRYEILTHQVETGMYNNDNEYGKKELVNEIQEWNEDLAAGKTMQKNLWVGILYPNIYDEFEYIPLDNLK